MLVQIGREGYSFGRYAFVNHVPPKIRIFGSRIPRNTFLDHISLHLNVLTPSIPKKRRTSPKAGLNKTQLGNVQLIYPTGECVSLLVEMTTDFKLGVCVMSYSKNCELWPSASNQFFHVLCITCIGECLNRIVVLHLIVVIIIQSFLSITANHYNIISACFWANPNITKLCTGSLHHLRITHVTKHGNNSVRNSSSK